MGRSSLMAVLTLPVCRCPRELASVNLASKALSVQTPWALPMGRRVIAIRCRRRRRRNTVRATMMSRRRTLNRSYPPEARCCLPPPPSPLPFLSPSHPPAARGFPPPWCCGPFNLAVHSPASPRDKKMERWYPGMSDLPTLEVIRVRGTYPSPPSRSSAPHPSTSTTDSLPMGWEVGIR